MAVVGKADLLATLQSILGERDDTEAIGFIENLTDTVTDYESKTADQTDWRTKFEENDKEWKRKYKERFFSSEAEEIIEEQKEDVIDDGKEITFDDLFQEREG